MQIFETLHRNRFHEIEISDLDWSYDVVGPKCILAPI